MTASRRRLPHIWDLQRVLFLTWRLHGSLPPNRFFSGGRLTSGEEFAALDRLLDEARTGPRHLQQPELANMVVEAIRYNAEVLQHYILHAFVVMPNHVHLLITPKVPLPGLMKSLKGITAKRANTALGLTGAPFWQEESYDHLVRNQDEFQRIRRYIENNPVRAGLVDKPTDYRWSSGADARVRAGPPGPAEADEGVGRGPGVRPTIP